MVAQTIDALRHTHAKQIIHQDLKPDNVLLNNKGEVKLSDYGLSQHMWRASIKDLKKVRGTGPYMSPEIYTIEGKAVYATDVWALGVFTYEMVELLRPFIAND